MRLLTHTRQPRRILGDTEIRGRWGCSHRSTHTYAHINTYRILADTEIRGRWGCCCHCRHYIFHHSRTRYSYAQHTTTLQHTATHCNTLQHTATHCNILQRTALWMALLMALWMAFFMALLMALLMAFHDDSFDDDAGLFWPWFSLSLLTRGLKLFFFSSKCPRWGCVRESCPPPSLMLSLSCTHSLSRARTRP